MNILIAVPWDQRIGGVAAVVGNLARDLERRGHRILFLYPGLNDRPTLKTSAWGFPGVELNLRPPAVAQRPIRSALGFGWSLFPTVRRLCALLRSARVDVVNIHYPTEHFAYLAVCRRLLPVRLVSSIHGADLFPGGRTSQPPSWSVRALLAASDAVVAPSAAVERDITALLPSLTGRTTFIHNGVDASEFTTQADCSDALPSGRYLLCIAAHNEKKGLDVLIQAFTEIRLEQPDLRLKLVGLGPLTSALKQQVERLNLQREVDFLGWQDRPAVVRLVQGCVLFALPSRSEPFGIALLEAMAARRPVVATAVGGIPEFVHDGTNGLLVPPDDAEALAGAVRRLLLDPELGRRLADRAAEDARLRFGTERVGERYERLFLRLRGKDRTGTKTP